MRPTGSNEQLAERRAQAQVWLAQGKKPKEVASLLGVTRRSVERWRHTQGKRKKKKAARGPGRPRKLSPKQERRLEKALDQGAYAFGYAGNYWTLDRISQVIWQLFGVRYHPSAVWHVMHRLGWSNQRPQRQALQRQDEAVEQWKTDDLPRIKKVSATARHPGSGR